MDEKALDAPKNVKEPTGKKAAKPIKEETKGDLGEADDQEDAFTTVEEKGPRTNRDKKPKWDKNQ